MNEEKLQKVLVDLVKGYIDEFNSLEERFDGGEISPSAFINEWDSQIKKLNELRDNAKANFLFSEAIIKAMNETIKQMKELNLNDK